MNLRRRRTAVIAIAGAAILAVICCVVVWRVERALQASTQEAVLKEVLGVEVRALGREPNPGFEAISSPAIYKSAVIYQGRICLAGPAGLYTYSINGEQERVYRAGIDLRAAPLGEMAVGVLTDARSTGAFDCNSRRGCFGL